MPCRKPRPSWNERRSLRWGGEPSRAASSRKRGWGLPSGGSRCGCGSVCCIPGLRSGIGAPGSAPHSQARCAGACADAHRGARGARAATPARGGRTQAQATATTCSIAPGGLCRRQLPVAPHVHPPGMPEAVAGRAAHLRGKPPPLRSRRAAPPADPQLALGEGAVGCFSATGLRHRPANSYNCGLRSAFVVPRRRLYAT